jgi:hypothetical protein
VYDSPQGIYLHDFGSLDAELIPGTGDIFGNPILSADGQTVAYSTASGERKRNSINGETPFVMTDEPGGPVATWIDNDAILYANAIGIYSLPVDGGIPVLLIPTGDAQRYGKPMMLPDGRHVLFSVVPFDNGFNWDDGGQVVVQSLQTGERKVLVNRGSDVTYSPTGHLLYALNDNLLAVKFDVEALETSGAPVRIASGLTRAVGSDSANYSITDNGTLVYLRNGGRPLRTVIWKDRLGNEELIDIPPKDYWYVQLAPDDSQIALNAWDDQNERDIFVYDFERQSLNFLSL